MVILTDVTTFPRKLIYCRISLVSERQLQDNYLYLYYTAGGRGDIEKAQEQGRCRNQMGKKRPLNNDIKSTVPPGNMEQDQSWIEK